MVDRQRMIVTGHQMEEAGAGPQWHLGSHVSGPEPVLWNHGCAQAAQPSLDDISPQGQAAVSRSFPLHSRGFRRGSAGLPRILPAHLKWQVSQAC